MGLVSAVVLVCWAIVATAVTVKLSRRGEATFDEDFTAADRRLAGAAAFYLGAPAAVLFAQLAQLGLLRLLGAEGVHLETYVYFGVVAPPGSLSAPERAGVALAAPAVLLVSAGALLAWTRAAPGSASINHLRLEVARVLLLLALAVWPILSLVLGRGDAFVVRTVLEARRAQSGDLALLAYGIFGAWVFWRWRNAHRLRILATPIHDAARRARRRLATEPDDAEALCALGAAELASGSPAALETLARARRLSPTDPRIELLLGRAHLERGQARDASERLRHAGELVEAQGDEHGLLFEVTLSLSAARIALGDAEGAILTARAACEQSPRDPRGLLMFADALVAGGRVEEARGRLEGALAEASGTLRREIERRLVALRRGARGR